MDRGVPAALSAAQVKRCTREERDQLLQHLSFFFFHFCNHVKRFSCEGVNILCSYPVKMLPVLLDFVFDIKETLQDGK